MLLNKDSLIEMKKIKDKVINLTLTDIPYGEVNRESNGLRQLDNKEQADNVNFDMTEMLDEITRITNNTIIIFCGIEQVSTIANYFNKLQKKGLGTMRQLIWTKTNPSPMNGKYIYLSSVENAIWFKFRGGTFNAHCKKNYFQHPTGRSKIHPTEKNHNLLKELILDNSNEGDIVFDPFAGSGAHLKVAKELNRKFIGFEIDKEFFEKAYQEVKQ